MHIDWSKFKQLAEVLTPIILTTLGINPSMVGLVSHSITLAEQAGQAAKLSGAEKKAYALDTVTTALTVVNTVKPGALKVEELTGVISDGIDLTVRAINAAKPAIATT